jgi:RimJ/RimL family protein N-acetyltransferase
VAELARQDWDPGWLDEHLACLLGAGIAKQDLQAWCDALDKVWARLLPATEPALCRRLGHLAFALGHWRIARNAFSACAGQGFWAADALVHLAQIARHTGDVQGLAELLPWLDGHVGATDTPPALADLASSLHAWHQRQLAGQTHPNRVSPPWQPALAWDEQSALRLDLLDDHHAHALCWLTNDAHLSALTRLPVLRNPGQALDFIRRLRRHPQRAAYAALHADAGLVGFSLLDWQARDATNICLAVSPHLRERGFGRGLLDLTQRQAQAAGLPPLHSEIWPGNRRSQATLAGKVAFTLAQP